MRPQNAHRRNAHIFSTRCDDADSADDGWCERVYMAALSVCVRVCTCGYVLWLIFKRFSHYTFILIKQGDMCVTSSSFWKFKKINTRGLQHLHQPRQIISTKQPYIRGLGWWWRCSWWWRWSTLGASAAASKANGFQAHRPATITTPRDIHEATSATANTRLKRFRLGRNVGAPLNGRVEQVLRRHSARVHWRMLFAVEGERWRVGGLGVVARMRGLAIVVEFLIWLGNICVTTGLRGVTAYTRLMEENIQHMMAKELVIHHYFFYE